MQVQFAGAVKAEKFDRGRLPLLIVKVGDGDFHVSVVGSARLFPSCAGIDVPPPRTVSG